MKRLIIVTVMLLFITAGLVIVTVPQGQAFATANFTASENVSIDFWAPEDIEDALTNALSSFAADLQTALSDTANTTIQEYITALQENQQDYIDTIFVFLLCVLISGLALWKNEGFLDLMAVPVDLVYGLSYAASQTIGSAAWVEGVIIAVIGTWLIYRRIRILINEARKKKQDGN